MKVLNFGSCNIDYVYSLPHFVKAGETIKSSDLSLFSGGKGLNQSIAMAKSGVPVCHAGCIGNDGEMLIDALKESNVDTSFIKIVDEPTGHAIIQVTDKGENSIIIYSGANDKITEEYVDEVLSSYSNGDVIVLQNEINNLEYIIDTAHNKGLQIILNPSPLNEVIGKLDLNKISTIVLNEVEALDITNETVPEKVCSYFKSKHSTLKVVLTLGHKGSVFFDCSNGKMIYQPAFAVEVKDTTSAGDTFMGYYVSAIYRGYNTEKALGFASAASALTVSKNGSSASIPLYSEVEAAMNTLRPINKDFDSKEILKKRIETYMIENIADVTLDSLAEFLQYSNSYTSAIVKELTGLSFTNLLQNVRCKKAGELLIETNLNIKDIMKLVGYENASFFKSKFAEVFDKSPLDYRKFYKKEEKDGE